MPKGKYTEEERKRLIEASDYPCIIRTFVGRNEGPHVVSAIDTLEDDIRYALDEQIEHGISGEELYTTNYTVNFITNEMYKEIINETE